MMGYMVDFLMNLAIREATVARTLFSFSSKSSWLVSIEAFTRRGRSSKIDTLKI